MDEKMQIEEITYERERLDFFTELMKHAQTRYNLLHRRFKDAPYLSEAHQTLSDMGREIQFFGDVVEMLEKGYRKQTEPISCGHEKGGEWISVSERLPEKEGYYITFTLCSNNGVIPLKFVFTTVRGQKVKRWEWNGRISPWVVTHWMPLPEPPKMKGGE